MVPFLYFFYDRPDLFGVVVSPEARVVLAHGTSLFVITPTAVRGAFAFDRSNLVEWRAVWPIGAASVLAAFVGGALAVNLPPEALKTGFGALLIVSGIRLVYRRGGVAGEGATEAVEPRLSLPRTISAGLLIGLLSAMLGVGGGTVGIPLLIYLLKLDLRQVAATSIGIMGFTAAAGALGYMFLGYGEPGLPRWSIGYVDFAAGLGLLIGAVVSVPPIRAAAIAFVGAVGRDAQPAAPASRAGADVRYVVHPDRPPARRCEPGCPGDFGNQRVIPPWGRPEDPRHVDRLAEERADDHGPGSRVPPATVPILVVSVLAVSWSAPLIRFTDVPALLVSFWRLAISLPLIAVILTARREWGALAALTRRELAVTALAGVFLAAHFATWIASVNLTSVAAAVTLVATQPVWVAIIALFALKESPTKRQWLGIVVAVLGAAVIGWWSLSGG